MCFLDSKFQENIALYGGYLKENTKKWKTKVANLWISVVQFFLQKI